MFCNGGKENRDVGREMLAVGIDCESVVEAEFPRLAETGLEGSALALVFREFDQSKREFRAGKNL